MRALLHRIVVASSSPSTASSCFRKAVALPSRRPNTVIRPNRDRRGVSRKAVTMTATVGTSTPLTGDAATAYESLTSKLRKLADLDAVEATLQWDELVMMPDGAAESRGRQKAALAELKHREATSEDLNSAIKLAEQSNCGDGCAFRAANIRDARRDYDDAVKVPAELKAKEAELGAKGYAAWNKARESDDFASFAPVLSELVELRKEFAAVCAAENQPPYDYLIDQFERGMTSTRLDEIFGSLREKLAPVIKQILDAPPLELHKVFTDKSVNAFPEEAQEKFCRAIAERMGFCFETGRFDTSVHPFTGGSGPFDVVRFPSTFFIP